MIEESSTANAPVEALPAEAAALVPVLQIVHITDMHVKSTSSNAIAALSQRGRLLTRFAKRLQRKNCFGWEEGTQGHLARAPVGFERFLRNWREHHPKWQDVPTWLVDTGDRTAFGDPESIGLGQKMVEAWSKALGDCPVRTLYGNHDMWPLTLPFLNPTDIEVQRLFVHSRPGWDTAKWLTEPLSVPIPGHPASIDLYAFDTVVSGIQNTLAVGEVTDASLTHFRALLEAKAKSKITGLRILALHHPVAFPWLKAETTTFGLPKMQLLGADDVASYLNNDIGIPAGFGPWAHLLLSGHTHMSHPAAGMSGEVASFAQRPLGAYQAQLVGSSLMLNRPSNARKPGEVVVEARDVDGFSSPSVFPHPCLAQILRFYASPDPEEPWIQMVRTPVYSNDDGRHYVAGDPDELLLHYRLPDM